MDARSEIRTSPSETLCRLALEEVRSACAAIDGADDPGTKIHNVRRSCKRMRAFLRLVAVALGERYDTENRAFRDIARKLSELRDTAVVVMSFEHYVQSAPGADELPELAAVRASLMPPKRQNREHDARVADKALRKVRKALAAAEQRIARWPLQDCSVQLLEAAAQRTYRRARTRFLALRHLRTEAAFHEWRKECKYHWLQLGFLRDVLGMHSIGREESVHALSETLGAAHDLAVLLERLKAAEEGYERECAFAIRIATRARVELEDRAVELGRDLFELEQFHGTHA
jgi:CHAD domain-containing protein